MRHQFITLCDKGYVFKLVAFHRSLTRHCPSFGLTVFCYDDEARRLIDELALDNVETVSFTELEGFDPELLTVKGDRNPVEYIWTTPPSLVLFMRERKPEVERFTYIDADHMFFNDPQPMFDEIGDASVALMPHRFAPEHRKQIVNGVHNGGFNSWRGDERALTALKWWRERCIEWCFHRIEDGKLGNQRYLDDWPQRFEGVHVLRHKGAGLAPWNISQYDLHRSGGTPMVDEDPVLFFHYHRTKLRANGRHDWRPHPFPIDRRGRRLIYKPYLKELDAAIARVRWVEPGFSAGFTTPPPARERIGGWLATRSLPRWRLRSRSA